MYVLSDVARWALAGESDETADRHVFPELRDAGRQTLLNRTVGIGEPAVAGRLAGALDFGDDVFNKLLEIGGPRHEVRLAVHLDKDAVSMIRGDTVADEPFGHHAPGFLRRAGQAAFPQNQGGVLEITAGFGERGFAFHHPRARLVAGVSNTQRSK